MYITDETLCPSAVQDSRCTARQSAVPRHNFSPSLEVI